MEIAKARICTSETPYKQRLFELYLKVGADNLNRQSVKATFENPYKHWLIRGSKNTIFKNARRLSKSLICSQNTRIGRSKTPINKGFSEIRNIPISKALFFIQFFKSKFLTEFNYSKKMSYLKTGKKYLIFKTQIFNRIFKLKKDTLRNVNVYRGFVSSKTQYSRNQSNEIKFTSVKRPLETSMNTGCFKGKFSRVFKTNQQRSRYAE